MQENNNTSLRPQKVAFYTTVCFLLMVIGLFIFRVYDSHLSFLLLLVGGLMVIRVFPFRRWTTIDICVGIITMYDLVSCFYANCPLPAIRVFLYSFYALVVYLTLRRLLSWKPTERIICLGINVMTSIALLIALLSFIVFRNSVLRVGFEDTYHFRFLFHPLGYITNVWSEVLLLLLGWLCLSRWRYSVVLIFLTFTAIFLSFSRGAYVATGIYIIGCIFVMHNVDKLRIIISALLAMGLVMICCPKEIWTTLEMNHNYSQKQSMEGRVQSTSAALKVFKERPLIGYGNGNYMYAIDTVTGQDSTKPFTSMAPNTLALLLVEKGIIGISLYVLLFFTIAKTLWKRGKHRESHIIGFTLLALLIKDMSQSAWEETPLLMQMTYLLLAYLQKKDEEELEQVQFSPSCYVVAGLALSAVLIWNIPDILQAADPTGTYLKQKDYRNAWMQHPEDVQLSYLYASRTLMKENSTEADSILYKLVRDFPKNSLYLSTYAVRCYDKDDKENACHMMAEAIRYTPRLLDYDKMNLWKNTDSAFHASVIQKVLATKPGNSALDYAHYGYVAHWKRDTLTANAYLREALKLLPNFATPYLLLGEHDKYKLLIYGAFCSDLRHIPLPEDPQINENYLLEKQVAVKVKKWYDSKYQIE